MLRNRLRISGMQPKESNFWLICKAKTVVLSCFHQPFLLHAFLPSHSLNTFLDGKSCVGLNLESPCSPRRCRESYANDVNWLQPS